MIRVTSLACKAESVRNKNGSVKEDSLKRETARFLGISPDHIRTLRIIKRSIDARKKPDIYDVFTVDILLAGMDEARFIRKCRLHGVSKSEEKTYCFPPSGKRRLLARPVIVGAGPAGLFCAYELALHGYRPLLLERGADVEERTRDVEAFWNGGTLKEDSNVQFGEGGAGTFSDGKLNTLVKDKDGRNREVLRIFCRFGAKEEILYDQKPHLGTDCLVEIIRRMREEIKSLGGEILFHARVQDFVTDEHTGDITRIVTADGRRFDCGALVLAIGHSARDTFEWLCKKGIPMEQKPFAVGLRVEHLQEEINLAMYGSPETGMLGAAPYKLTAKAMDGRGVYTFCMCPGGYVVNASSEEGRLAVNGMSYSGRSGSNANSAVIVTVTPEDFEGAHPLAGMHFQRKLEERAFAAGNGAVPVETYTDFKTDLIKRGVLEKREYEPGCACQNTIRPCIKGMHQFSEVSEILPEALAKAFVEGMEQFGRIIPGFAGENVLVEGIESRTSSPVRILRDSRTLKGCYDNFYPCGEGAGYAGGITSAAMDGIRIAEAIASEYAVFEGSHL